MIALFQLILLIKKENEIKLNNFKYIIFLFFIMYLFFNSFFLSKNLQVSTLSSLSFLRYLFLAIAIKFFFDLKKNQDNFFFIIKVALLTVCFDAIFQYFIGFNLLGFYNFEPSSSRVSGIFGNEKVLGGYLVRFFPFFLISIIYYEKNNIFKIFYLLSFVFAVIIAGERSALINLFISIIVLLFLFKYKNFNKIFNFKSFLFSLILLVILILSLNSYTLERYYEGKSLFSKPGAIVSIEHDQHYLTALKIFDDNKLFGAGPNTFRYICSDIKYFSGPKSCSTHPHNIFFQILSELGLVGLLFYLILFFYIGLFFLKIFCNKLFKQNENKNYNNFKLLIILNIFLSFNPFIPSGNFFGSWMSSVGFFSLGFLFIKKFD